MSKRFLNVIINSEFKISQVGVMFMGRKEFLKDVKKVVVKVGTSTLTHDNGLLNYEIIEKLVRQLANLHNKGYEVVLVSSGAVGAGLGYLKNYKKPMSIPEKQACAAVGQVALIHIYRKIFSEYGKNIGQVLLTKDDIADRERYLNARDAFFELLENDIIPIVNENDVVVTDEIKVGDNDTLSALVSNLVESDLLIILTDIDGLYDKNPKAHEDARLIHTVEQLDQEIMESAGDTVSKFGTGGMITKLKAAEIVTAYGTDMIIARGKEENIINRLLNCEALGTIFLRNKKIVNAKKQWIGFGTKTEGKIIIDAGAKQAIYNNNSLLPVGIKAVEGEFQRGSIVSICDEDNNEIGRGITNYDSDNLEKIIGVNSKDVRDILGFNSYDEVIHINRMMVKGR